MRAVIASMPWAHYYMPSIQVGALKAFLIAHGFDAVGAHWFVEIACWLGLRAYNELWYPHLEDAEALYGSLLFPEIRRRSQLSAYLCAKAARVRSTQDQRSTSQFSFSASFLARFDELHQAILDRYDWASIDLVGFTLNFGQTAASLYMAREIKHRNPHCRVIFGGAEATGRLGASLLANFGWVDFACDGEGENPLLALCRGIEAGQTLEELSRLPGIIGRDKAITIHRATQVAEIDQLPLPDYSEYYTDIESYTSHSAHELSSCIPVEASRGCQYHCSFCALNLQWEGIRSRSPVKVADMLEQLSSKHKVLDFFFVDNINPVGSREIFAKVRESRRDYRFFFELRANTPLETLEIMRSAGLSRAQIGVEAVSTQILSKFNKKSRLIHNVQAMKNCFELGIPVSANLIVDHPNISDENLEESILNMSLLSGFPPPDDLATFALQVGSPDEATNAGDTLEVTGNFHAYEKVYPKSLLKTLDLPRKEFRPLTHVTVWDRFKESYQTWKYRYQQVSARLGPGRPHLAYYDGGTFIRIEDHRKGDLELLLLEGLERDLYLALGQVRHVQQLSRHFPAVETGHIQAILNDLCEYGLCLREGEHYIALAMNGCRKYPWG